MTAGGSRHGTDAAFDGEHALFLACFDVYQRTIVAPAFAQVEAPSADLAAIERRLTQ